MSIPLDSELRLLLMQFKFLLDGTQKMKMFGNLISEMIKHPLETSYSGPHLQTISTKDNQDFSLSLWYLSELEVKEKSQKCLVDGVSYQ